MSDGRGRIPFDFPEDAAELIMCGMRPGDFDRCAAPLVWAKLLTVFDLFSFFGSMQIVVARMLKESVVYVCFLSLHLLCVPS